jgi:hypothetical protein
MQNPGQCAAQTMQGMRKRVSAIQGCGVLFRRLQDAGVEKAKG